MNSQNAINDKKEGLYNSSIINTYLKLVKKKYKFKNISDLLDYAKIELSQVRAEGHYFSQYQINRFHERLVELTGKDDISKEAGRYASSPEVLGKLAKLKYYFLSLGSPGNAYSKVDEIAYRLSRSSDYKSEFIKPNKVEVTVTRKEGIAEEPFQCEYRIGTFEGISKIFSIKPPAIHHTECMFKNGGGRVCRYVISWEKSKSMKLKQIRNYSFLFFPFICILLNQSVPWNILSLVIIIYVSFVALINWKIETLELEEFEEMREKTSKAYEEHYDQINMNYRNSLLMKELGEALRKELDVSGVLKQVIEIMEQRLEYSRGSILLANEEKTRLAYAEGFGYTKKEKNYWESMEDFRLDISDSEGPFVRAFHDKKSFYYEDVNKMKHKLSLRSLDLARFLRVKDLYGSPILFENESLGVLVVDNRSSKEPVSQNDINILEGIASQIGTSLNYIRLTSKFIDEKTESAIKAKEELLKAKENLVMRAVHNMRTPAAACASFLKVLSRDFIFEPEIEELLDGAKNQINRISGLANDFMLFIKPIHMRVEVIDLNDLIDDAIKQFRGIKSELQLKVVSRVDSPMIIADSKELSWIVEELITNSIKNGAHIINFSTECLEDSIRLIIEDDGSGVGRAFSEKLFEPFFSNDDMSPGIGLANVKKIIEEHNGKINLDSTYTFGARFIIDLPKKNFRNHKE